MRAMVFEFVLFGLKQARACLFPVLFFAILWLSTHLPLGGIARYDAIFLAILTVQLGLLLARIETVQELGVLGTFHLLGLALEIFKTHPAVASWSYPEPGIFKIGTVPLYSGFMYAAVASYMCQSWRILDLSLQHYPSYWLSVPLSAGIYLNFFTHHVMWDLRWWLLGAVMLVFWRTRVTFRVTRHTRWMPLTLAFGLIGFFIWVAENIATYFGAWRYPHQQTRWMLVSLGKLSAWWLLVIVSFIIVADLKHRRAFRRRSGREGGRSPTTPALQ